MKSFARILAALVTLNLVGCVTHTTADLRALNGEDEILEFDKTAKGIVVATCLTSFAHVDGARVTLHGKKVNYDKTGDFLLQDSALTVGQVVRGSIQVDRVSKRVVVDITVDGKPYRFNGQYAL